MSQNVKKMLSKLFRQLSGLGELRRLLSEKIEIGTMTIIISCLQMQKKMQLSISNNLGKKLRTKSDPLKTRKFVSSQTW